MIIRKGTIKDIPKIRVFLLDSWLMHANKEPKFVNPKTFENTNLKNYLKNCFNHSYKSYLFVAEDKEEIIGLIKLNIENIESFYYQKKALYIDDIYVSQDYRKQGISKKLIEATEKIAKKRNIKWLKARIYQFNQPAQNTFDSSGFKPLYSEYFKILE
ncbi:MAG: GNAT family N-acetyltransferase [Candidatus Shapirobacteria bacterium]|jgi:GNAT superfamily N-acetyltransferase